MQPYYETPTWNQDLTVSYRLWSSPPLDIYWYPEGLHGLEFCRARSLVPTQYLTRPKDLMWSFLNLYNLYNQRPPAWTHAWTQQWVPSSTQLNSLPELCGCRKGEWCWARARAQIMVRITESEIFDPNASVCQLTVEFTGFSCCGCVEVQLLSAICPISTNGMSSLALPSIIHVMLHKRHFSLHRPKCASLSQCLNCCNYV